MNRLLLFARKPAPVQVFWLSYPGGTGLSCIDYRLSDPHIDPPGSEADYAETTLRLPTTYWCYQPGGETPQRSDVPMKTEGMITFGSLTNFAKVGAAALELWAKVLAATPRSRLLMNCPKGTARQRVSERLAGHGIAPDRLDFVSHQPWPQYMETYQRIDIALDPTPYGGGITTCDSLWMGVPVVTLLGRTAVGRGATSVLRNIQLAELIATTPVDYVRIATELARDTDRLMALRGELPSHMQASALMDAREFARDVEAAYRQMWHTTCGAKQSVA
jgi:predicted O-linked N-acetylglucosamine transferase (SPINDLY family)